ncbi:APC family permease [Symbioplanes lichenis]|uniref:APC family permease n=1 Tax=Symbioplanes lichenis TaxID=1629072 RepID=UPI002738F5CA|nr:APC family permease [Actinoplanes lichenis]
MSAPINGLALTVAAVAVASPQATAREPVIVAAAGLLLLVFASACTGLVRRVPDAGGLYAPIAQGLGRPAGLGAAWLALAAYHSVQAGLYGMTGAVAAPLLDAPWWAVASACWLVVTIAGQVPVRVAVVLIVLAVLGQVVVIALRATMDIGGAGVTVDRAALGTMLLAGVLAFTGFETTAAFGRGSSGAVLLLIVLFGALSLGTGPLPAWAVVPAGWTTVAGLTAGALALQLTVARYLAALGREHVFPAGLTRPRAGALTQSVAAGLILGAFVALRIDPAGGWAARLALTGSLGVLLLLLGAALAALFLLNRRPAGEGLWRRLVAPVVAVVGLGTLVWLAYVHHGYLLAAASAPILVGLAHALALRITQPVVYAGVGLGGRVVVVAPDPAQLEAPRPRAAIGPGAHRPERVRRRELIGPVARRRTPGSG